MSGKKLEGIVHFTLLWVAGWLSYEILVHTLDTLVPALVVFILYAVFSVYLGYKCDNIIENK